MSTTSFDYSSNTLQAELEKPVVLLSMKQKESQRQIQQFLPGHYSVFVAPQKINGEPFDICIIDEFSIRSNLEILRQIKKTKASEFLPVMLLTSENSPLDKSQQIRDFADDILSIPVSTGIFNSRVEMLLKSRGYSLALKEKNERLEEQKNKYQLIAENSTDMISRHAPDGTYLYVSPASDQLLGYSPEELVGKNAYDFFHPDDIPALRDSHRAFSSSKNIISVSYRIHTKDNGYKWVETTSRLVWHKQNNELLEIQSSTRDISDRKVYEEQLKQEKELLTTTIDSLPGIFYMLDSEMNLVRWNSNFGDELGYTDEEIAQKSYREYFAPDDYEILKQSVKKVWTHGYADVEIDLLDSEGKTHRYYLIARTMIKEGRMYLVGSGVDISDRVEAERELEHSLEEKNILLQEIHHRVKNNLAVVSGLLELQSEEIENKEVRDLLTKSRARIYSIAKVHEMLYKHNELNRINFKSYITELTKTLSMFSHEEDKDIEYHYDLEEVYLNIDQAISCGMLVNELITNAAKHAFNEQDKGTIRIELSQQDQQVTIMVADNGSGLPEPFDLESNKTLGKTIIRLLMDQLQAELDINQENDAGAVFKLTFKKRAYSGPSKQV
ncbi:MAG: PAS domain S-box protein [Balneolaceae bacterium]|nr:PAS domain S-box protein [Balneolaceae bacterium]